jgi:hypothetical protein
MAKRDLLAVLRYRKDRRSQATVRRAYAAWRSEQSIPDRCDNEQCCFHLKPLQWNGKPLPLMLDHRNGNCRDNAPGNLRYLCPNCHEQLPTRGGANRGRWRDFTEDGHTEVNRDGSKIVTATGRAGGQSSVGGVSRPRR